MEVPHILFSSGLKELMQTTRPEKPLKNLEVELANRRHNLSVIEETMQRNPRSEANLSSVREMLTKRIADLNTQLASYRLHR